MSEIDEAELLGAGRSGNVADAAMDGGKRTVQAALLRRCCYEFEGPDRPSRAAADQCDRGWLPGSGWPIGAFSAPLRRMRIWRPRRSRGRGGYRREGFGTYPARARPERNWSPAGALPQTDDSDGDTAGRRRGRSAMVAAI